MNGNPNGAAELLYHAGFVVPDDLHSLVEAVKELVRRKGQPVINELLKIHPEREIILAANGHKVTDSYCPGCDHDHFGGCGCNHDNFTGKCKCQQHDSFNGNGQAWWEEAVQDLWADLKSMGKRELMEYYRELTAERKANPQDSLLQKEAEIVEAELQERDLLPPTQATQPADSTTTAANPPATKPPASNRKNGSTSKQTGTVIQVSGGALLLGGLGVGAIALLAKLIKGS